jgi:hypothetical protein
MIKIQTLHLLKKLNKKAGLPGFELNFLLTKAIGLDELEEFIELRRLEGLINDWIYIIET